MTRFVVLFALVLAPFHAFGEDIAGKWHGTLRIGAIELRVLFNIDAAGDGYTGTMDSIDQGAMGIPLSAVTLEGDQVVFTSAQVGGTFTGSLQADGQTLEGAWKQGPSSIPLTLTRSHTAPKLVRPQEPKAPFPYREILVSYANANAEGVTLAATLTLPQGEGPFPAAVLITGSGPQDRDESLLGHKPFLVLADHLTRNGIAVLRADDRGVGKSTGTFATATLDDFVSDALAGVAFLNTRDDIGAIGLIGHSEGGIAAPRASLQSDNIAFAVLLAGTAVPGDELLAAQGRAIMQSMGIGEAVIERSAEIQAQTFNILDEEADNEQARERLLALYSELTPAEIAMSGVTEEAYQAQVDMVLTPWFRNFLKYDPREALALMRCPVLALFGELDVQVPPSQNEPEMRKALETHADATVIVFDGLNHLFQPANTGAPVEYGRIETTMSPEVLDTISDWVLERTK